MKSTGWPSSDYLLTEKAEGLKPGAKQKGISILDEMLVGISEEELSSFLVTLHKLNRNREWARINLLQR